MKRGTLAIAVLAMSLGVNAHAQNAAEWATPSEASNYKTTPDAAATMQYLHRVADAAPGTGAHREVWRDR